MRTTFPRWGSPVVSDAKEGFITDKNDWDAEAGIADLALYPVANIVAAVGEVKTPWSLKASNLEELFEEIWVEEQGKFQWIAAPLLQRI